MERKKDPLDALPKGTFDLEVSSSISLVMFIRTNLLSLKSSGSIGFGSSLRYGVPLPRNIR